MVAEEVYLYAHSDASTSADGASDLGGGGWGGAERVTVEEGRAPDPAGHAGILAHVDGNTHDHDQG